jgi:hypothetical protein
LNDLDRRRALLVHRGELRDLRKVLTDLDVDVFERAGTVHPEEAAQRWDLVISTPALVPDLPCDGDRKRPPSIVVLENTTRMLVKRLERTGVDFLIQRPFHPTALRLLLVRALYRGPERRRTPRVQVGAPARVERGLRRSHGLLLDLSAEGCRVRLDRGFRRGDRVTLILPRGITGGRRLTLRADVARSGWSQEPDANSRELVLRFAKLSVRKTNRLADTIERHMSGPAALDAPVDTSGAQDADLERRRWPRRPFERRVIALGDEAARVLVGRDLSLGGMRVEPNQALRVGETLRLALHGGDAEGPAVVEARVVRDESERGYVLRFSRLADRERRYLESLLANLPALRDPTAGGPEGDLVVSERIA